MQGTDQKICASDGLKIVRQVSITVLENSLIFRDSQKGQPLMKEMRLVFLHYWTVLYIGGNLRQLLPQMLKSSKKQYRQANS